MKLPFLDRTDEIKKLGKLLAGPEPALAVVYGRRRCGKSRLLQQLKTARSVYYLADQSGHSLQRQELARRLSLVLPGFDHATYHTWQALFEAVNAREPRTALKPMTVILDEFPYLVSESPALPSLIQKMMDTGAMRFHLVLAGSFQRMMKGLVFNENAPLYGRAREVIKIRPLLPGWLEDALALKGAAAIAHYAVWGGVPRYWELASEFSEPLQAIEELVLNRDGILHNEPRRILLDDMRSDTQPHSLLAVIGSGVHRISEISSRMEKPAMNLLKPLATLTELGLVKREIPFGELEKNSKRTLYTIADPFLRFWYQYVYPNISALEQELYQPVLTMWLESQNQFIGRVWEDLARASVPRLAIGGKRWKQAQRWWGKSASRENLEFDIVAESLDGSAILLGEAKWGNEKAEAICRKLEILSTHIPFTKGKRIVTACWFGHPGKHSAAQPNVLTPEQVLSVLR